MKLVINMNYSVHFSFVFPVVFVATNALVLMLCFLLICNVQ